MNRLDNLEKQLASREVEAPTMTSIRPKDIMLGRGPTWYNNPGNKAFRKVIKKNVKYYKNQDMRKDKAAFVKLLVSKLELKGYRFLHQSANRTWVKAPPNLAENKVGHSLRDARLEAAKPRSDVDVLPKDFRLDDTEPKLRTMQASHQRGGKYHGGNDDE